MRYVRTRLGKKPVQELTEDDIDALITWMLTEARRIGGKPGTGLSVRTADLTLGRLRAVLELGIRRQVLTRNVAQREGPRRPQGGPQEEEGEEALERG